MFPPVILSSYIITIKIHNRSRARVRGKRQASAQNQGALLKTLESYAFRS